MIMSATANAYLITANGAIGGAGEWNVATGSNHTGLRSALADTANFGSGGVVNESITINAFGGGTLDLSSSDAFLAAWWGDGVVTQQQRDEVTRFFQNGGDLILFQDDSSHDVFGADLGLGAIDGTSDPTTIFAPLDGPFGSPNPVSQAGNVSHLDNASIHSLGGTICGTNAAGQATIACFAEGAYGVGYGSLTIVSDIDLISAWGGASYSPLNDKGILGLNIFANAMATTSSNTEATTNDVDEPSAMLLLSIGLLGLFQRRRKTAA